MLPSLRNLLAEAKRRARIALNRGDLRELDRAYLDQKRLEREKDGLENEARAYRGDRTER